MSRSERLAKRVVEALISGAEMRFNDAQGRDDVDFDLHRPEQPTAAAEVTEHIDSQYDETAKAIDDPMKGGA